MHRCKAPEILRSEAYFRVRRNDEGRGKRSRWAFFNSLLAVKKYIQSAGHAAFLAEQYLIPFDAGVMVNNSF